MKLKGIKKICSETKNCDYYGGAVEVSLNFKTGELIGIYRRDRGSFSFWEDESIHVIDKIFCYMTMNELKERFENNDMIWRYENGYELR